MRKSLVSLALVCPLLGLAACGSDDGGSAPAKASGGASTGASTSGGGGSLAGKTIKINMVTDLTGVAAFAGKPAQDGAEFAVKEANASGELNGAKLELDAADAGSDVAQDAALTSKAAASDSVAEVFGVTSQGALAAVPVAQKGKLSAVLVQSGAPGTVETGDYIFRTTAPQETFHELQVKHFQDAGYKRVGILVNTEVPTLVSLEKLYQGWASKYGYSVVAEQKYTNADTDFTAGASKMIAAKPDVVLLLAQGPQGPGMVTALSRAGYKGAFAGNAGTSGGALKPAGKAADGTTYPVDFTAKTPLAGGKKFAAAYKAGTGQDAVNFTAEGYDAVRAIVEAVKVSNGDVSREGIHKALLAVTQKGYVGAAGPISFVNRDARVPGILVAWEGGPEKIISAGADQ
jgi:branched-chain amino acid transport system substrate-binding protein